MRKVKLEDTFVNLKCPDTRGLCDKNENRLRTLYDYNRSKEEVPLGYYCQVSVNNSQSSQKVQLMANDLVFTQAINYLGVSKHYVSDFSSLPEIKVFQDSVKLTYVNTGVLKAEDFSVSIRFYAGGQTDLWRLLVSIMLVIVLARIGLYFCRKVLGKDK